MCGGGGRFGSSILVLDAVFGLGLWLAGGLCESQIVARWERVVLEERREKRESGRIERD